MAISKSMASNMPWKVELPMAQNLRDTRIEWCKRNIGVGARPSWIAPKLITEKEWWWHSKNEPEAWCFREHEDAVMFDMVWNEMG